MKKTARNILFFLFATAFFVLSPLVLLYTAGYRITLNNQRIKQTGALAISTLPRGATISVDGYAHSTRTPNVIQNVSPNTVTVKLEKKGYLPFEEKVVVNAGKTTYVNAILFADSPLSTLAPGSLTPKNGLNNDPKEIPDNIKLINNGSNIEVYLATNNDQKLIALLPVGNYISLIEDTEYLILKNQQNNAYSISLTSSEVTAIPGNVSYFDYYADEKLLLFSDGLEIAVYDLQNKSKNLLTRQGEAITNLVFYPTGTMAIFSTINKVTAISLETYEKRPTTLLVEMKNEIILNFWLDDSGRNLYLQTIKDNKEYLYQRKLVK